MHTHIPTLFSDYSDLKINMNMHLIRSLSPVFLNTNYKTLMSAVLRAFSLLTEMMSKKSLRVHMLPNVLKFNGLKVVLIQGPPGVLEEVHSYYS